MAGTLARAWIPLVGGASLACGCITIGAKPEDAKSRHYEVGSPGAGWTPDDAGTADVAYRSADGDATLALNSVCDQYQKLSLEELAETSLAGLTVRARETHEGVRLAGVPALGTSLAGTLDGKPFRMALTVARGPRCVYDVALIATPDAYGRHVRAYEAFLSSFRLAPGTLPAGADTSSAGLTATFSAPSGDGSAMR